MPQKWLIPGLETMLEWRSMIRQQASCGDLFRGQRNQHKIDPGSLTGLHMHPLCRLLGSDRVENNLYHGLIAIVIGVDDEVVLSRGVDIATEVIFHVALAGMIFVFDKVLSVFGRHAV